MNSEFTFEKNSAIQTVWEACDSQIFWVCDENGVAVANAQVRHLLGKFWLYCDDTDGYAIHQEAEVESWNLVEEDPKLGFDRDGSVKPLHECFE